MPRRSRKPPRRQARQQRSQETIRIILEAAAQVLRVEGYARTTTNHVAGAAGVSVGTIYQYFANKDELFDALIQQYFGEILERVRANPPDTSRPLEVAIRQVVAAGIGAQRHGPELLRALEQIPNAIFRRRLSEGKQQLTTFVRALLESYRDTLRVADLDRAATLMVNAAEGIGYNAGAGSFDDRLVDDLTVLFIRYLVADEGAADPPCVTMTP